MPIEGLLVSRETLSDLTILCDMVRKWNQSISLVSKGSIAAMWERHVVDSAKLAELIATNGNWLDLGSGGGFPGLVVAIAMKHRGSGFIHLVESDRRKAGFLQLVSGELRLPTKVHAKRSDKIDVQNIDVVTARALASLNKLLVLSESWLTTGAVGVFHKGRGYREEVKAALPFWDFELLEHSSTLDQQGVILEIRRLRRRN